MPVSRRCAVLAVVALLPALAAFASSSERWPGFEHVDGDHDAARALKENGAILPLDTIVDSALRRWHGLLLEAELGRAAGRYIYEIELLDDRGVVHELYFDAATGEPLALPEDR